MPSTHTDESTEVRLLEVEKLEKLIAAASWLDGDQRRYLLERWLHQIRWWNQRAWEARRYYFRLRAVVVIGAVLSPFLVSVHLSGEADPWLRLAGALISLAVAICAGLEALYGWGSIWLEKRRAAELLKVEGWLFLHRAASYEEGEGSQAFHNFVTKVESQIASEVGEYVTVAQQARRSEPAPSSPPVAASTAQAARPGPVPERG
jgi:hypothetical protein